MREIKFRGLDKMGNWHYGYVSHVTESDVNGHSVNYWGIYNGKYQEIVRPETIGEYTGLKDKNGIEIYEGDIVRDYDEGYLYKVIYNDYDAQFQFHDPVDDNYYSNNDLANHEIIGNIHETPELLEKA